MHPDPSPDRRVRRAVKIAPRARPCPAPAAHPDGVARAVSIQHDDLVHEMKARGEDVVVLPPGGACFAVPPFGFGDLPVPDGCRSLTISQREHRVSAVPGIGRGARCDGCVPVSVGTGRGERTRRGIRRIPRLIDDMAAKAHAAAARAALAA